MIMDRGCNHQEPEARKIPQLRASIDSAEFSAIGIHRRHERSMDAGEGNLVPAMWGTSISVLSRQPAQLRPACSFLCEHAVGTALRSAHDYVVGQALPVTGAYARQIIGYEMSFEGERRFYLVKSEVVYPRTRIYPETCLED